VVWILGGSVLRMGATEQQQQAGEEGGAPLKTDVVTYGMSA
jgi:hypothetical protein